ncbi:MAG TPA: bacillithiol biosynthesis BshC, partial [Pyrinomonadaceae bacterium]|nr:bacillithiol biosynthesis BshC [Pyrinomonadaceae bacterium]
VAYFGGGAEVAYFAQTAEVYRLLGRPATPILHRAGFTFVERRAGRALERYGLHVTDFFGGLDAVVERVVDEHLGADTAREFERAESNVNRSLDELHEHLRTFDPTLADALNAGRRKILYQLEGLRTRFRRARMQRDRAAMRQLERAAASVFPEKALQERRLNVASLHARHGRYFLDWAYSAIDLSSVEHRIVYL